jgi:hypothetical protein
MEKWSVAKCRSKDGDIYYLANRQRTVIKISKRNKNFDILKLLEKLEEVGFPLRFTNGIQQINFTILGKSDFGWYLDDEVAIDVKRKRRLKTLVETFVHEVAHHIDFSRIRTISYNLHSERKRKGRYIHSIASESDDEYFARGFERFYSLDPTQKSDLRKHNPKLYHEILRLHRQYKSR